MKTGQRSALQQKLSEHQTREVLWVQITSKLLHLL